MVFSWKTKFYNILLPNRGCKNRKSATFWSTSQNTAGSVICPIDAFLKSTKDGGYQNEKISSITAGTGYGY